MPTRKVISTAFFSVVGLSGCAVSPNIENGWNSAIEAVKDNSGVIIGCIAGVGGGLVIGGMADGEKGAIKGAVAGAAVGCLVGYRHDEKRKALEAAAQKHGLDVQIQAISATPKDLLSKGAATSAMDIAVQDYQGGKLENNKNIVGVSADINTNTMFLSGKSTYSSYKHEQAIKDIAKVFIASEAKGKESTASKILVVGHTDSSGSDTLNMKLSLARAKAVAQTLVAAGISEDRIYIKGAGESQPVSTNQTAQGRAKNRRVEIAEQNISEQGVLNYAAYRTQSLESMAHRVADNRSRKTASASHSTFKQNAVKVAPLIDFGGAQYTDQLAGTVWDHVQPSTASSSWSFLQKAHASSAPSFSCLDDGPVKETDVIKLSTGNSVRPHTTEFVPGAYGNSWFDKDVNDHLVALNDVAVLRSDLQPYGVPEVLVYKNYKAGSSSKPDYRVKAEGVNVYRGKDSLLYRVFLGDGSAPISCIDMVLPQAKPSLESPVAHLVYGQAGEYLAKFSPQRRK